MLKSNTSVSSPRLFAHLFPLETPFCKRFGILVSLWGSKASRLSQPQATAVRGRTGVWLPRDDNRLTDLRPMCHVQETWQLLFKDVFTENCRFYIRSKIVSEVGWKTGKNSTLYDNSWNRDLTETTQKCKERVAGSWAGGQRLDQRAMIHVLPGDLVTRALQAPMALPYTFRLQRKLPSRNLQLLPCFADCISLLPFPRAFWKNKTKQKPDPES